MPRKFLATGILITLILFFPLQADSQQIGSWMPRGSTEFATGVGQAIVGTSEHLYVARAANSNNPSEFWRGTATASTINWAKLEIHGDLPLQGAFRNGTALAWDGDDTIYALTGARYEDKQGINGQGSCQTPDLNSNSQVARCGFYEYSISESKWTKLAPTPKLQGAGNSLIYVEVDEGKYLYATLGASARNRGVSKSNSRYQAVLARYALTEPSAHQWGITEHVISNCVDDGASLAWNGKQKLYLILGSDCDDQPSKRFGILDLKSDVLRWSNSLPAPVNDGGSLVYADGKLFLITGGYKEESKDLETDPQGFFILEEQDSQRSWTKGSRLPCSIGYRTGNRLALVDQRLYFWTGSPESPNCSGRDVFELVENVASKLK